MADDRNPPVAVAPGAEHDGRIARIAVGYDGREPSRRALDAACALASGLRAQLLLIGVVEPMSLSATLPGDDRDAINDAMRGDMEQPLSKAAAAIPSTLRASTRLATGLAGAALFDACSEEDVDLLVLGTRAYGSVVGALAGSVSREIVNHPACPVMVIPGGAAPAPGLTSAGAGTHR